MTSVSAAAGQIILTPTQPVGGGRPLRDSNPGQPHQESRALLTELPPPSPLRERGQNKIVHVTKTVVLDHTLEKDGMPIEMTPFPVKTVKNLIHNRERV